MTRAASMPRHSKPRSASWAPARPGITLARELAGSTFRVVVLESGGFEFHHRPQLLYLGANVGLPSYSPARSRFRFFGGSTTRWGKQCRPLDAIDFEPGRALTTAVGR
jgi:choline dehydrogenase-like flavoprotein